MKIYLAANFATKELIKEFREKLEKLGHIVTSSWIDSVHEYEINKDQEKYCMQDLHDISNSDVLILFVDQYKERPGRGKYIEYGFALGEGLKYLIIFGEDCEESIFFFYRRSYRFKLEKEVLKFLEDLRN